MKSNIIRACARCFFTMVFVASLFGCTEKKDLSPPPLNHDPRDQLRIFVEPQSLNEFNLRLVAQYGNLIPSCGNIDYAHSLGGHVEMPRKDVPIGQEDGAFSVYLDRYVARPSCSWKLLGVGIWITDKNGHTVTSALNSDELYPGVKKDIVCDFTWPHGFCLVKSESKGRSGVRVNISTK